MEEINNTGNSIKIDNSIKTDNSLGALDKKDKLWISLMEMGARFGCHQMESRSFSFRGYQFPLCARCTGVLAGEILGIIMILLGCRIPYFLMLIFIWIMGMDWYIQHLKIRESTNIRRLITGTLCGIGMAYLYFYVIRFIVGLIFISFK